MALRLDTLTVDSLADTPLADAVELLVARNPATFRERLAQVDMAELSEMPDDIAQAYGWRAPDELATWRSIELALGLDSDTEGFWKSGDMSLGLDLYPDVLSPEDEEEEMEGGDFLPPAAEVLFTGLFRLAEHASGDRTLVSLLPDPLGLLRVHSYGHDTGQLGRPRSLKSFVLSSWLSEMDPGEGPGRPGQVGIPRVKQLLRVVDAYDERLESIRRDHQPPAATDSAKLYARSRWLIDLLWGSAGPSLPEHLAQAPTLQDWEAEQSLLLEHPPLANYWMVAHYFLGNDAACAEAVRLASQARPAPTRWIAQAVSGLRGHPDTASLRRTGPGQLAEIRRQVRAAALPSQLAGR